MIRSIDTTDQTLPKPKAVAPATPAGKSSFAAVHAKAVADQTPATDASSTDTTTGDATTTADATTKAAATKGHARIDAPDGETWGPVAGHNNYVKITGGPRAGQYVNLSRGDRRGQAFSIETRDGKTVHVYGTGDSEQVVDPSADGTDGKAVKGATKPPKGETWGPVAGHNNYADILTGSRNGLFVNISGGVRNGMAFQIVKHGDKTFHVYGSGKTRQVIEVGAHKKKADSPPAANGTTPASGTTGGKPADSTGGTSADTSGK